MIVQTLSVGPMQANCYILGCEETRAAMVIDPGEEALMEVTQIGKVCHSRCAIYYQAGDCVMPREGIFTKILKGGVVRENDPVVVVD